MGKQPDFLLQAARIAGQAPTAAHNPVASGSLAGLWIAGQKYFLKSLPVRPVPKEDISVFAQAKDWLRRYFAGERPAASEVYRLAYARTGCRADAEDVMQEVFLRLIKAGPTFAGQEHAKAWLLRVTSNCANDLFRLPWRRREGLARVVP